MPTKRAYIFVIPVATALIFAIAAWGRTYNLQPTSTVPGATGTIDTKAQKAGGNVELTLKVDHLARPALLSPPANEYVVWIQPSNGQPVNEGTLQVSDDEKGDLKMTTSAPRFAVIVTAETQANAQTPSQRVILRTNVEE